MLIATALGPVTVSGYARTAQLWRRGTPLSAAVELFAADTTDMSAGVWVARTADAAYPVVVHRPAFFDAVYHLVRPDGLVRLDLPVDATPNFAADQMLVSRAFTSILAPARARRSGASRPPAMRCSSRC